MKRFIIVCFTMFLTFVLLVGACAEGIQSEQVDLPVEEEVNVPLFSGELGESELPTVEKDAFGTDVADFSDMVFVVEAAPLDADDTEAGEQAVMAASNECKHEKVYSSWSSDQPRFTASGKYQHNVDYNVSSTTLYCYDCKDWLGISNIAVGSYNPSKPAHIQHSEACVFDPETGKCYFCGQTGKACAHKNYVNCGRQKDVYSFYNNLNHVHKVVTPSLKAVCLCKTCGMVGQVQNNGTVNWNWCSLEGYMTDYMNGFIENENDQIEIKSSKLEAHTYVNGVCSKCGYVGGAPANDDMPVLCATRMNMGKGDILKLASSKKGYTFSSSDNKVARISKKGVITAVSVGKATITAKSKSGQKATCKVTVLKGPKKVTLNKSQVTLEKGKTCQLKATLPKGTHTWNLTWTSSNKDVAKVSSKGKVTAVGNGTAKITVETAGGVKATCKVTVKKAPNKVTLNKSQVTLEKGKTFQLKATLPSGTYTSKLTWTSNNAKVAKVSSEGMITAVGKGTATITVKTAGGVKATCKVTVENKVGRIDSTPSIEWNSPYATVTSAGNSDPDKGTLISEDMIGKVLMINDTVGGWFRLIAPQDGDYTFSVLADTITDDFFRLCPSINGNRVSGFRIYKSSMIQKGVVKNVKQGEIITWWDCDNTDRWWTFLQPFKLKITIEPHSNPKEFNAPANDDMPVLCATRMNMGKGDILKLASSKKGYTFSSSDNKVAKISKKGVITAVSVGKATITVKSKGGQKATCKVTVLKGPKKVTLNKSQVTLEKGKTCQLIATLPKGTYTWNLTWTSSNKEVAKVSSKGKVTAVGNGTAKITVETAGGVKATCKVTVEIPSNSTGTWKSTDFDGIKFYSGPQTYGDGYYTQTWFILKSCQTAPQFINFSWDSNVQMLRREGDHPEYSVLREGITQIQEYDMDQLSWSDGIKGSALVLYLPDNKEIAGKQSIEFAVGEKTIIADIQLEYYPEEIRGEDWGFWYVEFLGYYVKER